MPADTLLKRPVVSSFVSVVFSVVFSTVLFTLFLPQPAYTSPAVKPVTYDLVKYMDSHQGAKNNQEIDAKIPPYNRTQMFGGWVNEDGPTNCYNTRAEVLIRDIDDKTALEFSAHNRCQVAKGSWIDPYSGARFLDAREIQIDHVVPLKNAYRSGAYQWPNDKKCHYANYLSAQDHLLAVSGRENMSKGDAGPETYLPPNTGYVCPYLKNWMKIKAVWKLNFTEVEALSIHAALKAYGCDLSFQSVAKTDFDKQRRLVTQINKKCIMPAKNQTLP